MGMNRREKRRRNLLTRGVEKKLPGLKGTAGQGDGAVARAKFFTPDSSWTWFATEYDPETRTFFGLVKGFETEVGYFRLDELQQVRGKLGLPVERDLWFQPKALREIWDNDAA